MIDFSRYEINDKDLVNAHLIAGECLKETKCFEEALYNFEEAKSVLISLYEKIFNQSI
jgi:hypothetical protein